MGWYHISYRSYNAVRPPLSPRFSPALPLYPSSRSHSIAFPHPLATLVSLPCPSSPSHSFSFSLALSSLPRVPSSRVTSRRFFSRRFLHLCLCRLFARFLSPFRSYFLAPASSSPAVFRSLSPFPSPSLHRHAALHPGTFPFSLLAVVRRSTTVRPSYLSSATHTRYVALRPRGC